MCEMSKGFFINCLEHFVSHYEGKRQRVLLWLVFIFYFILFFVLILKVRQKERRRGLRLNWMGADIAFVLRSVRSVCFMKICTIKNSVVPQCR